MGAQASGIAPNQTSAAGGAKGKLSPRSAFAMLAGARVCVVETGTAEQRASARASAQRIRAMDGALAPDVGSFATHVGIPAGLSVHLGPRTRAALQLACRHNLDVVEIEPWLCAVAALIPGQHWSEVPLEPLIPVCLAFLDEAGDLSREVVPHVRTPTAVAQREGCADLDPSPFIVAQDLDDSQPLGGAPRDGRRRRGDLADELGR